MSIDDGRCNMICGRMGCMGLYRLLDVVVDTFQMSTDHFDPLRFLRLLLLPLLQLFPFLKG